MQTNNQLSLAYLSVPGSHPIAHIEAAAEAGFDAVGLRTVAPLGLALNPQIIGNKSLIHEIKQACERTGISVADAELLTLTGHTVIEEMHPALAVAAELGCTYMQVVSEDSDWSRAVDHFAALCDEAKRYGMRMALEFMRWRSVKSIQEAARFVAEAGKDNGGILLDTLHLSRSGGSPAAVASIPKEKIFYVQLCDAPTEMPRDEDILAEARCGRMYPGQGGLWLKELMDVVPDNILISLEVPRAEDQHLSVNTRAKNAADAIHRYLSQYRSKSSEAAC